VRRHLKTQTALSSFGLALLLPLSGCGGSGQGEAKSEAPAKVQGAVKETELATLTLKPEAEKRLGIVTVRAEYRAAPRAQHFGGEVISPPGRAVTVTAPFAGTVLAPEGGAPQVGASLRKDQPVLRLLPLTPGSDLRVEADRDLAAADARAEAARARLKRAEQMLADRAGSVRGVEEAREQLKIAEADGAAARARVARIRMTGADAQGGLLLAAPSEAVLQKLTASPGQTVAAGAPLFEAAGTNPVWVRVPVYAGALATLGRGGAARVNKLGANGGAGREARPVAPPVSGEASAATVDLYFEMSNPEGAWRPGERVDVALPMTGEEKSLVVPWAAVLFDVNGGAWVYENSAPQTYVRRRIEVRHVSGGWAVLARGPAAGARVVTDGAAELFGTEFSTGK